VNIGIIVNVYVAIVQMTTVYVVLTVMMNLNFD
jgi:hypothetical protein